MGGEEAIKHTATGEYGCDHTMAYEQGFRNAVEMSIGSWDSQDPRGYRMDHLGTLRRPADSACI